ncbi:hypothetical protein [Brevibacterium samyangense]|uniref:Cell filamentation protein n=1 Tax=Brevibacterium samyangense TaxID=366888 RepID=A0ABP5EVW1_9MICO
MNRQHEFRTRDDYYIPGSFVLRNRFSTSAKPFGETDPDVLRTLEEFATSQRLVELSENPIPGAFDYAHMRAIHRYIFQDVYEWAGEPRVGPDTWMTKDGPNVLDATDPTPVAYAYYPGGDVMNEAAEAEYAKLAGKGFLRGLPLDEFVGECAETWGELNTGGSALLGEELIGAHDE